MRSHARLLKLGLEKDPVTVTRFLQDYLTLPSPESLPYARHLFDQVPCKDNFLWTAMISVYARSYQPTEAIHLLSQMNRRRLSNGPRPNHYAYASAARAVGSIADPRLAKTVHSQVLKQGFQSNLVVGTSVLDMYAKCNDIVAAGTLFDEMPQRNIFTWNSMISGFATGGLGFHAFELFYRMRSIEFEECDEFTVASVLTACAGIGDMSSGIQIHGYSVSAGFEADPASKNALANMYFRCGEVELARKAMEGRERDVLSKIMMIKGFTFNDRYTDVITSIGDGEFMEIVERDYSVVVSILSACANLKLLRMGRQVHGLIITFSHSQNHHSTDSIITSALIDMYFRCSSVGEARRVFSNVKDISISHWNSMIVGFINNGIVGEARMFFDQMPERSLISWTAMMSGYVHNGFPMETLRLLANYYSEDNLVLGNCSILATALDACSCLASMDAGKQIHAMVIKTMAESEVSDYTVVETALVDVYSKSGNLSCAQKVFNRMRKRNVVSWTSMITAYAVHGSGFEAVKLFEEMLKMGLEPNEITFVSILNACSHCGLVEDGVHYFKMMKNFGISPTRDHYTCLVDMLGRFGKLDEAWNLAKDIKDSGMNYDKSMKINKVQDGSIWGALLGGCLLHGNVEIGSKVAGKMLENKQQTSDAYVALSNVYATAELWNEVYRVREEWRNQGVAKEPGHSQIQIMV